MNKAKDIQKKTGLKKKPFKKHSAMEKRLRQLEKRVQRLEDRGVVFGTRFSK